MKRANVKLIPQPNNYDCQATCIAMLAGLNAASVGAIYESLSVHGAPGDYLNINNELRFRLRNVAEVTLNSNASMNDLDKALEDGPCILQGYFTRAGHVLVILEKVKDGYKVLDPWTEFDGEYFNYNRGKSLGYCGVYSSNLICSTCFSSVSYAYALQDYRLGKVDYTLQGGWLHTVRYFDDSPHVRTNSSSSAAPIATSTTRGV